MTNKEAITNLLALKSAQIARVGIDVDLETFDVAIKALGERPEGEWIRLNLAKGVIAKFNGYLDEDMIERIQIALEKENYDEEVVKSPVPVLLDFWATWCGPCRMLSPIVDEIANEVEGNAKVCKINVDEQPELAQQFGIMSIPTLVFMKNGEITAKEVGVRSKQVILDKLN